MTKISKLALAVSVAASSLLATSANAALITQFQIDVTNVWTAATFTDPPGASAANTTDLTLGTASSTGSAMPDGSDPSQPESTDYNIISWGTPTNSTGQNPNLYQSFLAADAATSVNVTTNGAAVNGSNLYHGNYTQVATPGSVLQWLDTATLTTTVTITPLVPPAPGFALPPLVFPVDFEETINQGSLGSCPSLEDPFPVGTVPCPDSFTFNPVDITANAIIGEYEYFFRVRFDLNAPSTFLDYDDNGAGPDTLWTAENQRSRLATLVDVQARLVPVPEPTTMALFGLGILGFGALRRRKA
jgi:PEP-CTERM motif